jgi:hypothetical protein
VCICPILGHQGRRLRTTQRRVGATGRGGAFTSPTAMVVAEGAKLPIGTALAVAWSAIGSQPVMSCRISGIGSWYSTPTDEGPFSVPSQGAVGLGRWHRSRTQTVVHPGPSVVPTPRGR